MKKVVKRGRPLGSRNKPKEIMKKIFQQNDIATKQLVKLEHLKELSVKLENLQELSERQDHAIAQATDQIADLQGQVEFYRKQVNHFLALLNILAKGA